MPIRHYKEPTTATHRYLKNSRYIRLGRNDEVHEFINGEWQLSYLLNQDDVFITNRKQFITLFKTGVAKFICNLYLYSVRSGYRVP